MSASAAPRGRRRRTARRRPRPAHHGQATTTHTHTQLIALPLNPHPIFSRRTAPPPPFPSAQPHHPFLSSLAAPRVPLHSHATHPRPRRRAIFWHHGARMVWGLGWALRAAPLPLTRLPTLRAPYFSAMNRRGRACCLGAQQPCPGRPAHLFLHSRPPVRHSVPRLQAAARARRRPAATRAAGAAALNTREDFQARSELGHPLLFTPFPLKPTFVALFSPLPPFERCACLPLTAPSSPAPRVDLAHTAHGALTDAGRAAPVPPTVSPILCHGPNAFRGPEIAPPYPSFSARQH